MTVVTGLAHAVLEAGERPNPAAWLRERKSRKYMGLQDDLAVVCAGQAIERASLTGALPAERTGLFIAVGFIPFRERDIVPVLTGSVADGRFSMERFAADGYKRAHPLLAFRCLPNMPAYHIAANLDVQGPYYVTYPSVGQLYLAMEQAQQALEEGRVDVALVCGVAHQRNFLVEHHFRRCEPPVDGERLRDAGAVAVFERDDDARTRGAPLRASLCELTIGYRAFDPRQQMPAHAEWTQLDGDSSSQPAAELGPASLLVALSEACAEPRGRRLVHRLQGRDGLTATSSWELAP